MNDFLNYRHEVKFTEMSSSPDASLTRIVTGKPLVFELFPKRMVNNIYFDTSKYQLFWKAREGGSPRLKVRLRWYGDFFCNDQPAQIELKIKRNTQNTKKVFNLEKWSINHKSVIYSLNSILAPLNLHPELAGLSKVLFPSLLNSYERYYFAPTKREFRLTFDKNLAFHKVRNHGILELPRIREKTLSVTEIKFENLGEATRNYLTLLNKRHARVQFSKYVFGLINSH